MRKIPDEWMPASPMERVICHWTVGRYRANSIDRAAYHILIEGDGSLVRGTYSIKANSSLRQGRAYAAHTKGCNSRSIGISCCSMLRARSEPVFDPGPEPMTELQWNVMAEVAAQLCDAYSIPVTPATVLGHGEVQEILNKPQNGKWDPMVLPWNPELPPTEVGDLFRQQVSHHLVREDGPEPVLQLASVVIKGRKFDQAILENESTYVLAEPVIEAFELQTQLLDDENPTIVEVTYQNRKFRVPCARFQGELYVDVRQIAEMFDLAIDWNPRAKVVTLS